VKNANGWNGVLLILNKAGSGGLLRFTHKIETFLHIYAESPVATGSRGKYGFRTSLFLEPVQVSKGF
jgi:hypothetical protein